MKDIIVITEGGRQVVTHLEDLNEAMRYVADFGHKVESAHYWEDDPQNEESDAFGAIEYHPHEIMAIREMIGEVIGWNEYDVEVLGVDFKREFATCVILDDGAHTGDLVPVSLWLLLS